MKPIEKMSYPELKKESILRGLKVIGVTTSSMKNNLQTHRDENPDFVLVDKPLTPTVTNVKPADEKKSAQTKEDMAKKTKKVAKKSAPKKAVVKKATVKKEKTKTKSTGVAQIIRDLYDGGKGLDVAAIKKKLNLEEGHYVNDIIWHVEQKKKAKK